MLSSPYILNGTTLQSSSATQAQPIGSKAIDQIGRSYRYALAGGTTLVTGDLQAAAADDVQFTGMAVQANVAIGATVIPVTLGSTATTAGMFTDGILSVSAGTGIGQTFHIIGHDVASGAATCNFYVEEPVIVALTSASSKATTTRNPYAGVIIAPSTKSGMPCGGAIYPITNAQYGWIQTGGIGACLADATATTAPLTGLSQSVSTPGCVTRAVAQDFIVGISLPILTVSAKCNPIFWNIT